MPCTHSRFSRGIAAFNDAPMPTMTTLLAERSSVAGSSSGTWPTPHCCSRTRSSDADWRARNSPTPRAEA